MQEKKSSDTVTKSSLRKDEIEATKGIKNFGTKPSYSPASPLCCQRRTNQEISRAKLFIS